MSPWEGPIRDHFVSPRNVGEVPGGARGRGTSPPCGDELDLWLGIRDGRLGPVRFRARACSAVIAAASLATEALEGRTPAEARRLDLGALLEEAGGLPPGRDHARGVVERALAQALDALEAGADSGS